MRVIVDESAWDDLNSIGGWIAKDSPKAARAVLDDILQFTAYLEIFPRFGHVGRARNTYERNIPGTPYIIVYEISRKPAGVIVIGIVHGARDR